MSDPTTSTTESSRGEPAETVTSRRTRPRKRTARGPGWFAPLFWLALCAAFVFLRFRSFGHADFVVFHTRSGDVQGVASHKGQVLLAVSTLSLGLERALTLERDAVPAAEFDKLYQLVYGSVQGRKEFLGFGFAATQKGDIPGDATHTAFAAPHWFFALLAGIPALRGVWLLVRYYTRPGRGRCRSCGYDLRGTGGAVPGMRCPECGEVVAEEGAAAPASGAARRAARTVAILAAVLLLGAAAVHVARKSRPVLPPVHPDYSPAQVQAGFARPVGKVEFDGVPLDEAVRRLAAATGTRIDVDWGELESLDVFARLKVNARFDEDVALAAALRHILPERSRLRPGLFVNGDGIRVSRYPPGPPQYLVRVYDVRPLLEAIPDDPLPPPPVMSRVPNGVPLPGQGAWSARAEARGTLVNLLEAETGSRLSYAVVQGVLFRAATPARAPGAVRDYGGHLIVVQTEEEQWRIGKLLRDVSFTWDGRRGRAVPARRSEQVRERAR
jgi:hypothetical protein